MFKTLQTYTRMGRSVFPLQNEYNGTCILGVACNPLDWSPRIPIDVQLFSFSVNRDHTIVFVDLFTNRISSLGPSLLQ